MARAHATNKTKRANILPEREQSLTQRVRVRLGPTLRRCISIISVLFHAIRARCFVIRFNSSCVASTSSRRCANVEQESYKASELEVHDGLLFARTIPWPCVAFPLFRALFVASALFTGFCFILRIQVAFECVTFHLCAASIRLCSLREPSLFSYRARPF